MAYVLGFIYADGAIIDSRISSRTCYLLLSNNDSDLLYQIGKTMSSNHRLDYRPAIERNFGKGKTYLCKPSYRLRIGNRLIYSDLLQLGLSPKKSLTILLPALPNEFFSFFLRGYFDGDGCVNICRRGINQKTIQVVFVSGSFMFLKKLNENISNILGTKPKNIPFQSGAFRLAFKSREAVAVCRLMYHDLSLAPYLKRKYKIYKNYLQGLITSR